MAEVGEIEFNTKEAVVLTQGWPQPKTKESLLESSNSFTNSNSIRAAHNFKVEQMNEELMKKMEEEKLGVLSKQVGGSHYKQYKIQPYEFFIANQTPHHKAAIIRRILRYDHPTGRGLEDLQKIMHEVEMIIQLENWESTEESEIGTQAKEKTC